MLFEQPFDEDIGVEFVAQKSVEFARQLFINSQRAEKQQIFH